MRAILCSAIAVGLLAGCALKPANPLDDPEWIPITVNIQSVYNAHVYADAGINTYVGIDDVTTELTEPYHVLPDARTLKILGDLGMYAMVFQDQWGHLKDNPVIIAWLSPVDEPDNIQGGTGEAIPLPEYLAEAEKIKAFDDSKPYTVCFGQGVINDLFKGRGIDRRESP